MTSVVAALRASLARAYYGTPPYMIPFKIILPQTLSAPLPPLEEDVQKVGRRGLDTRTGHERVGSKSLLGCLDALAANTGIH